MPVQLSAFHLTAITRAGTKNGQFRLSLQPRCQLLSIVAAQSRQVLAGGFTCTIKQRWQDNQRQQHDATQRERNGNVQNRQPQRDHHNHHKRPHDGRDDAQVKVIQRVDIGYDTVE